MRENQKPEVTGKNPGRGQEAGPAVGIDERIRAGVDIEGHQAAQDFHSQRDGKREDRNMRKVADQCRTESPQPASAEQEIGKGKQGDK